MRSVFGWEKEMILYKDSNIECENKENDNEITTKHKTSQWRHFESEQYSCILFSEAEFKRSARTFLGDIYSWMHITVPVIDTQKIVNPYSYPFDWRLNLMYVDMKGIHRALQAKVNRLNRRLKIKCIQKTLDKWIGSNTKRSTSLNWFAYALSITLSDLKECGNLKPNLFLFQEK